MPDATFIIELYNISRCLRYIHHLMLNEDKETKMGVQLASGNEEATKRTAVSFVQRSILAHYISLVTESNYTWKTAVCEGSLKSIQERVENLGE